MASVKGKIELFFSKTLVFTLQVRHLFILPGQSSKHFF